jgi:hypothetical protein
METETAYDLAIGDRLANGATVLQVSDDSDRAGQRAFTVLAVWRTNEFVTWRVTGHDREAFWGHYHHDDLAAALADFHARVQR